MRGNFRVAPSAHSNAYYTYTQSFYRPTSIPNGNTTDIQTIYSIQNLQTACHVAC